MRSRLWASLLIACSKPVAPADAGAPAPIRITSSDPSISAPDMQGWQWTEDARSGDGFTLHELKWHRTTRAGDVFLYAKDYALANTETIASLMSRDWRAFYKPLMSHVDTLDVHETTFHDSRAVAVRAEGRGVVVDETYVPQADHLFVITASGPLPSLDWMAKDIATWRAGVELGK